MAGEGPRHSHMGEGSKHRLEPPRTRISDRKRRCVHVVRSALLVPLAATIGVSLGGSTPASGQSFGQWWWDASVGFAERSYENLIDGERQSRFDQRDLKLSLGVNGYVLHPAIAQFRLGVDAFLSQIESGRVFKSNRTGYDASLSLFPQSYYPSRVWVRREIFSYANLSEDDPWTLFGVADTSTTWGGRFRLRRGPLHGTLFGFERTELAFLEADARNRIHEREFVAWSGDGKGRQRHLRLERSLENFGVSDFQLQTTTLTFDQRQQVGPDWRWDLSGVALDRGIGVAGGGEVGVQSGHLHSSWVRNAAKSDDLLTLIYDGGFASGGSDTVQTHLATARYLWRRAKHWEFTPFFRLGYQEATDETIQSPQLGISTNWRRSHQSLDMSVSGAVSYLALRRSGGRSSGTDTLVAVSADSSLGHGDENRLREELELSLTRNNLRLAGETLNALPDLGVPLAGTGTQDVNRVRLTFKRRWGSRLATAYGDWAHRSAAGMRSETDFDLEVVTYNLQFTGARFGWLATAGQTVLDAARTGNQKSNFESISASYRPVRRLSLNASYRTDDRRLLLSPNIEGERAEAGLDLSFGAYRLQAKYFESNERLLGGSERTNRGITVNLSRRLAGWLPIVTGNRRRGVIR